MFCKQLSLLLWKNFILRKRHWLRTLIEVIWPLFLFAILIAIRLTQPIVTEGECHYSARAMPSAGVYPWLKSLVCNIQSSCSNRVFPSEIPGQVNSRLKNTSKIDKLGAGLEGLQQLLNINSSFLNDIIPHTSANFNDFADDPIGASKKDLASILGMANPSYPYRSQIESYRASFLSLIDGLEALQNLGNKSLASSLLGINASSSDALNIFCDYPKATNNSDADQSGFMHELSNLTSDLDPRSSSFCYNLTQKLEDKHNLKLHFIWQTIKPFFLGKIPFSPNTALVNKVIENANATFQTLALIQNFGENWQKTIGPALYKQLDSGSNANLLRRILGAPSAAASFLNISSEKLNQLGDYLSNNDDANDDQITWKDTFHQIDDGIAWMTKILECSELNKFVGFENEDQLANHSSFLIGSNLLWGGVVFLSPNQSEKSLPKIVRYKIRQDPAVVTKTDEIEKIVWRPGSHGNSTAARSELTETHPVRYYISGFVHLQDMIETAIVKTSLGASSSESDVNFLFGNYLQEMPYPCYTKDMFLVYLSGLFSLMMTLAWIYSVCIIIKNIVYEKEKRLKEVMKMMGLSNGVHWVAWFINALVVMLCSILLLLILLKFGKILPYSNMFIVMLWLMSFATATICQCFLISCFFTKANLAAACGGIMFFVLYIPYNVVYIFNGEMTIYTKLMACLLSSVAFGYGSNYISLYEMSGDGIQFSNWSSSPDSSDQLNFLTSLIMMLVDAFIYMVLTWYIEYVFPGTYGVPKRWYFFATSSYWFGTSKKGSYTLHHDNISVDFEDVKMEREPEHLPLGVSMQKLRKVFENGKVAVDDLSLNFYEGQITSFLGHNGAGKTTTMSMLTGLFTPTSGSASIYGNDIQTEMDQIRHQLGFCPQHNVLFGDLTVLEHLQLYSGLKNAAGGKSEDKEEIKQMLDDVGLPQKKNEMSRHLSGGMKRKLSVAVAFVGGSKCVILDEPTAGVDPYARRGIWDLLLRYRNNRTILLSTHHMDEADLLGDRIAIISHGKLKCCGSSLFLKSSFGVGYYLTVVKNDEKTFSDELPVSETEQSHSVRFDDTSKHRSDRDRFSSMFDEGFVSCSENSSSFGSGSVSTPVRSHTFSSESSILKKSSRTSAVQSTLIVDLVLNTIPKAKIQEENQREITFVLPYEGQATGKYTELFRKLDNKLISYGLTDTSLEEIFLNVAEQSKDEGKEETTKCCFCIPRTRTDSSRQASDESLEAQARRGSRRSVTSRSITSNVSDFSFSPLLSQLRHTDDVSLFCHNMDGLENETLEADDGSGGKGSYKVSENKLVWQQFKALFVKRFHHAKRNRKGLIAQIIVPAAFVAIGLLCALAAPQLKNMPALELQPWMYGNTNTFYSNDMLDNALSESVSESLIDKPSLGMRCVDDYVVTNYDGTKISCDKMQNGDWSDDDNVASHSQDARSNNTLVCTCTNNGTRVLLARCPDGAGGNPTPRVTTQSSDFMYNMTGRNVSDWLVKTVDRFIRKRYGGLSMGETLHTDLTAKQLSPLIKLAKTYSNFSLKKTNGDVETVSSFAENIARTENAKVWFDNNGFHSMPTWLNVLNNAVLRSTLSADSLAPRYGIVAINHPLNFTNSSLDAAARPAAFTGTLISISVIFALSFVPASFVLFLVEEKITKSKHLQFVSGVNQTIYWISTFLWDLINYSFTILVVITIFVCFQTRAYVSAENFPCLITLLFFYGFSSIPMMYPASFFFEVPSTAYVVLTCVNMFIGINASLTTFILEALQSTSLDNVNSVLKSVLLIFPQYCLGRGLIDMAVDQSYSDAYSSITGVYEPVTPFDFENVGRNLLAMAIEGIGFFALTLLLQYNFFLKLFFSVRRSNNFSSYDPDADDDVLKERKRLLERRSDDILKIQGLSKVYAKRGSYMSHLIAVNRLYVGVPKGECFGLLGVNGAGKTTTFKMLTGDISPTAGDAYICNQSILDNIREVQQNTGYCPQFDALNSLLTGREHLIFYAKLRGVPPEECDRVADWAIEKFGLKMYAKKPAGTYSGGNKRKLSAAIAFIGCPPIVFLDEPTAGMDPMARRFLWSRIAEAVRGGRCIVLTSHSMEECEALCTRLAIMVNGKFQCLGSPQHLKNRYGEGYTITIKVGGLNPDFESVQSFISSSFNNTVLKESHCNMLMYQVPLDSARLSDLFTVLENCKKSMHIEDYSISQTTLDEVFVTFAKNQTDGFDGVGDFEPLNDDSVLDYSQTSDRRREMSQSAAIPMQSFTAGSLQRNARQLLV